MARFYSNENFPQPVVRALRLLGHDVLTVLEAGNADQSIFDDEVLRFATRNQRIVLTINRKDFIQLHKFAKPHAGIIACTLDLDFTGQAQRINDMIVSVDDLSNKLLRVNKAG